MHGNYPFLSTIDLYSDSCATLSSCTTREFLRENPTVMSLSTDPARPCASLLYRHHPCLPSFLVMSSGYPRCNFPLIFDATPSLLEVSWGACGSAAGLPIPGSWWIPFCSIRPVGVGVSVLCLRTNVSLTGMGVKDRATRSGGSWTHDQPLSQHQVCWRRSLRHRPPCQRS